MNLSDFALASALKRREKQKQAQERRKEREAQKKENAMADQANVETPATPAPARALSMEEIIQLLNYQNQLNQENMVRAIQEMKKPTEEEQRKLDEQKAKDLRAVKSRVEVGEAEYKRRTERQKLCGHKRPDGSWAASGQQLSGNEYEGKVYENCTQLAVVMCLQCQKALFIGPTNPMFAQGLPVNINIQNVQ